MQIHLETIDSGRPPKGAKFFGAVARGVPYTTSGVPIVLPRKEKEMSQPGFYFFTGDWLKDTRVLSPVVRGCWIDALCFLNENQGSVTWPISSFANFWGVTIDVAVEILDAIAMAKVGNVSWQTDGKTLAKLSNRRMLREIAKRIETKEKRSKAGKKGAAIRWQKCDSSESYLSDPSYLKDLRERAVPMAPPRALSKPELIIDNDLGLGDKHPAVLCGWDLWNRLNQFWKSMNRKLGIFQLEMIYRRLDEAKTKGYDPVEMVQRTLRNGWMDIYEPDNEPEKSPPIDSTALKQRVLDRIEQAKKEQKK